MNIIRFILKHSHNAVLVSLAAGILSGGCNAALLGLINSVLKSESPSRLVMWSFVTLCILLPLSRYTAEVLLSKLGQGALYQLRMHLCSQILAAPLLHLEQIGAPRLLTTLTDDIPTITAAILPIPVLCVNAALVIGCLIYLGFLSPLLLAIVLGFMILGIATYQIPILKAQKFFGEARKEADALQIHFRALTQGTKELKMHSLRRQAFVKGALQATAEALQHHNMSGLQIYGGASSWGQSLVFVVVGLIIFVLPAVRHMSGAALTAYAITLLYLMTPLQVIMNMLPVVSRANVALKTVQDLGFTLSSQASEITADASSMDGNPSLMTQWQVLELRDVTHSYKRDDETDSFILGPINLTFKPGEVTFISGGNGSGKTTLVKLITGLYRPESGEIYFNRKRIDSQSNEYYRQHFSVVFADFYLFEQLLGIGGPGLDLDARRYLEQLKLSTKVQIENGKLSTIDLSHGQRKRLALLTAYVEDRPIYIFDEWAADQDPYFKAVFYKQLLPGLKARNKTVLVVSHDERYFHVADRMIKLEDGHVVSDTSALQEEGVQSSMFVAG